MRIICDHCSHPVLGAVKRVPGNLNLHPDCPIQLSAEAKPETAVSWRNLDPSFVRMRELMGTGPSVSREMES